jgi:hypothetical protein
MELHFKVDAEGIVDTVRSFWMERSYSRALSLFTDCLGLTLNDAFEVLSGKKTFSRLDDGRFSIVDDDWTPPDGYAKPSMEVVYGQMREWENVREDWAKLKNISILAWSAKGMAISMARPGSGYTHASPVGVVKDSYVVDLITDVFEEPTQEEFSSFWGENAETFRQRYDIDFLESYVAGDYDTEKIEIIKSPPPEPEENLESRNGFILRDGKFYACEYAGHDELADRLLEHLGIEYGMDAGQEAENQGWAKIQTWQNGGMVLLTKRPTKRQRDTIMSWCANHNVKLPYIMQEEDF